MDESQPPVPSLVGDGLPVPCVDGRDRPYLNLDSAASANALPAVARRVEAFLPWYSSVHRGAGYKSRLATNAYEEARLAARTAVDDQRQGQQPANLRTVWTFARQRPQFTTGMVRSCETQRRAHPTSPSSDSHIRTANRNDRDLKTPESRSHRDLV